MYSRGITDTGNLSVAILLSLSTSSKPRRTNGHGKPLSSIVLTSELFKRGGDFYYV